MVVKKGAILTKFGITNPDTMERILTIAEKEGGHVYEAIKILHYTGMHPSSLLAMKGMTYIVDTTLRWTRPKTTKVLSAELDNSIYEFAERWLMRKRRYSQSWLGQVVKEVGRRAGYPDLAPTTFRHTKCLELITKNRKDPLMVPIVMQKLGCTEKVVFRNYARLLELEESK